ncbi:MAG: ribosomal L7Ae/L30e/S12e/Gadd45 family protein [Eubacterium sp.]|nr:ribosomal L7Ae/L30e/S12e/Gadd45 family protein [Eubacterium sp.]
MDKTRAASMIGIARKAGKVAAGEFSAEKALKEGAAALVILSEDASENTQKKFRDKASYRHIPVYTFLPKEELGRCVGLGERSVLAITDRALAEAVRGLIEKKTEGKA